MFSLVVLVKGRQECYSSSTDIHPFLKPLNHSWVCIWPRALSPNAPWSILFVSKAVLLSLKQNLVQIHCSFTSVILAGWWDRKRALPWRHKNAQKKHTHPHSRKSLDRVVHKGYRLRYLAAHSCTTSGFCAAVLFRGLLGSITYIAAECHSAVKWIKVVPTKTLNRNPRQFIWLEMCWKCVYFHTVQSSKLRITDCVCLFAFVRNVPFDFVMPQKKHWQGTHCVQFMWFIFVFARCGRACLQCPQWLNTMRMAV